MAGKRKSRMQGGAPLQWAAVGGVLHMTLNDAAAELNVPITYLRSLCRKNGFPQWPGKKIRSMNRRAGKNVVLEVAGLGLAGPSHLAKIVAETKKREEKVVLQWADVSGLLHMRLKDPAAELNVSITYLRRLCRQNGFAQWPGKKVRFMNKSTGKEEEEEEEEEEEDMDSIDEPVANHPPGEELTTLNLIDKIGSSSGSGCS